MSRSGPVTRDTSAVPLGLAQIRVGASAPNIAKETIALTKEHSIGALASTSFSGNTEFWKLESGFPLMEDLSIPLRETASLTCAFRELTSKNLAMARGLDPIADVPATINVVGFVTSTGTTTGNIAVDDLGGVVNDTFTVIFQTGTSISIHGNVTGHIGDFNDLTVDIAPLNGANPYFTIPANFFDSNWIADEQYVFETTPFVPGTSMYSDNHSGEIKLGAMKTPDFIRVEAVYTYPNQINHMYIIFPRGNATSSLELEFQLEEGATVPLTFEAKRADDEVMGGHSVWNDKPLGRIYFD